MGKKDERTCPICGSKNIVITFDAGGLAFCIDCDWHVGSHYSPELKKAIISMFRKCFDIERQDHKVSYARRNQEITPYEHPTTIMSARHELGYVQNLNDEE